MIKSKEKVLVLTIDDKEKPLKWLDYMLRSSVGVLDNDVRVFICTDSPEAVSCAIRGMGFDSRVNIIDVRETIARSGLDKVSKLSFHGVNISPLQMFRLAIPIESTFAKYDTVVFCDVDVGFESSRWNDIFNEDVSNVDILAVRDCKYKEDIVRRLCNELSKTDAFRNAPERCRNRIVNGEYYAAGALVMNLKRLRECHGEYSDFLKRMIKECVEEQLPQLDQSLINLHFDIKEITPSYNAWSSNSIEGMPVWMRHYPGPQKIRENFYPIRGRYVPQQKVDIVYTIGDVSNHDDQELRWSLRSIAKYGKNIGRVIVTSPVARDWLSDGVIQVDCQDLPNAGYKHHNILRAIMATIDVLDLHGEFLVSSDDHFYVQETDFARYPFHVRKWNVEDYAVEKKDGSPYSEWKQSCSDTGKFLRGRGLPTIDFQGHANSHWNADLVRDNVEMFKEAMLLPYCVEPHVLMQNLWISKQPDIPIAYRKDAKIKEFRGTDGIDCLSCYDFTFIDDNFVNFMNGEFGEKCRYER